MSDIPFISVQALPSDLRARLESSTEPAVLRHHPESKREAPQRWLLLPIVAVASFGALCAALIPGAAFTQLTSIALFIGAGLLGAVVARSRQRSLRPEEGQRLLVGSASLALVHRDHVEILPAESIRIGDDGELHFRGSPFDQGGHDAVWMDSLRKSIEAASRNETDRWREAAKMGTPEVNRGTPTAVGVAVGLVIALGIELVPLASASDGAWSALHKRVESHHEWMLTREQAMHEKFRAEFDEKLPKVKTAMEAISLLLDVQARGLGPEFEGPTKDKLRALALTELAAAEDTKTVEPLIRMALAKQIRPSFLDKAKQRYSVLVDAELEANPTVESFETFLLQVRTLHLGDGVRSTVVSQVMRAGNAALSSAKNQEEVAPYLRLCIAHSLEDEFCESVRTEFATLARKQLRSTTTEEQFSSIESLVALANMGDEFEEPLRVRRRLLALRSIKEADSGKALDAAAKWLDRVSPDYTEVLNERMTERAIRLAKVTSTSRDAAKLIPFLPEEQQLPLIERYQVMAAEEARTGTIEDARAFLRARDFSAHPDRDAVDERLISLCRGAYDLEGEVDDNTVNFFSALLGEMCIQDTSTLTYRLGRDSNIGGYGSAHVTNVADAAPELAKIATEMATLLGRPIEVRHKESRNDALIVLRVEGLASLGEIVYPCTLHISRRFEADGPEKMQVVASCSRIWEP